MNTQNKITDFLNRHNYILKVVIKENILICSFEDKMWEYCFGKTNNDNFIYINVRYNSYVETLVLPSEVLRWYIFLDILRFCRNNKLSYHIIKYFNESGKEVEFDQLTLLDYSAQTKEKEELLYKYLLSGLNSKDFSKEKELSENGLLYSWLILKGLLL